MSHYAVIELQGHKWSVSPPSLKPEEIPGLPVREALAGSPHKGTLQEAGNVCSGSGVLTWNWGNPRDLPTWDLRPNAQKWGKGVGGEGAWTTGGQSWNLNLLKKLSRCYLLEWRGGGGEAQSACLKVVAGTTEHPSNRHGCENVVPLSAPAWPRATGRPSESLQWETSLHCLHITVKGGKHSQVPNGDLSEWVTPREASPVHHKRRGHFVRPVFLVILVPRK